METTRETIHASDEKSLILVVEDNDINAEVVRLYLRHMYTVDWALNGEMALKMIDEHPYAAILLDIHLGLGIDGYQVIRTIRSNPEHQSLPVIALTGYALSNEKETILQSGCDYCIAKPFTKSQLLSALEQALGKPDSIKILLNSP